MQAMDAAASIISETDLVLTGLALRFCTTLLRQQRTLAPHVIRRVLPPALALVKSPMLQVSSHSDSVWMLQGPPLPLALFPKPFTPHRKPQAAGHLSIQSAGCCSKQLSFCMRHIESMFESFCV